MEIRRYLRIILSRKWVVILTTEAALLVAALVSATMAPVYSSTATLRVAQAVGGGTSYQDVQYAERVIQTYVHLLMARPFLESTISRLKLPLNPDQLAGMVKVSEVPNTELIQVSVDSRDPQQAASIANTLAVLLVEQGQRLYSGQGKSAREIVQEQLQAAADQLRRDRELLATLSTASAGTPEATPSAQATELSSRIEAEQRTYNSLLEQYDQAQVNEAIRANSVSVADPATPPTVPSRPRIALNTLLGGILGLIGGLGLALVLENLAPAVHGAEDVKEVTELPIVGRIPAFRRRRSGELLLVHRRTAFSAPAEAFRRLSSQLLSLLGRRRLRHVLLTSIETHAGKSTVLANLAVAMAQTGTQVLLVDADLRHPSLHQLFGVPGGPGLVDVIRDPSTLDTSIQQTKVPGVRLLRAGLLQGQPGELLTAQTVPAIVRELADRADTVLWDSPPIAAAADASLLAPILDGVLLLVMQDRTPKAGIESAEEDLVRVGGTPLGVILNRSNERTASDYPYYPFLELQATKRPGPNGAQAGNAVSTRVSRGDGSESKNTGNGKQS